MMFKPNNSQILNSPKYPIKAAPMERAGPFKCPAELCTSFTGVAFSWEEIASFKE